MMRDVTRNVPRDVTCAVTVTCDVTCAVTVSRWGGGRSLGSGAPKVAQVPIPLPVSYAMPGTGIAHAALRAAS
eukprot:3941384-Rhodomonas_salina.7